MKCRTRSSRSVRLIEDDGEEIFQTSAAGEIDDSQCVTLQLDSGNYLRFQVDTGAQCNVVPLDLYKKATKDFELSQVKPARHTIRAYGGSKLKVVGRALIRVRRGDFRCWLDCKLVDQQGIRPILGRKASLGMEIVAYLDNDDLNKPDTKEAKVYTVGDRDSPVTKEQLVKQYPTVFSDGVGLLEGEYRIAIDPKAVPVEHAARRVPVALREKLQQTLQDLVKQEVLAPVQGPTAWVSSMVVVPKRDGKIRICIDPQELNAAIQREHYQLPTIEEIATRLPGAKVFTVLDARHGFWHIHVALDEASSYLTTFNTPFGRYRWKRMPFGIKSAPEVFQRRMHEVVEGLQGVEVVADDFVVVGCGNADEATQNHDQNLDAFLQRCKERNLKLNDKKLKLRMSEVPFIGHVATAGGLCVDPKKVQAIVEMPPPSDVAAVQRLLGLAQYLSKFLPRLADLTKPLRELTQRDVVWSWGPQQQQALEELKKAVSNAPVLGYYNVQEEVTLQCDASQAGVGAALMQNGQPIAYASRVLTSAETRYAQIEKELLAIVFACEHFEVYIFGREVVNVETDHLPLEAIAQKPLNKAPSRLQRMLLRLQKFNLKVKYKRGKEMYLADTLSRAPVIGVHACSFAEELESVDHTTSLAIPTAQLQRLKDMSFHDPVMTVLKETIQKGWPSSKSEVPESVYPYFDFRDELVVQDNLVFKGPQVVIPAALRKEMMSLIHESHIGIEGCIRRARETLFWPRMSSELKEYIAKCDVCMTHRSAPGREPIMQHKFAARPWAKIGADLCDHAGRILLIVSDYYSNYIEVEHLNKATTNTVTKALKEMFARYGVPDVLVSDNGPQFSSEEFAAFAKTWRFEHITSSPHYP